MSGNRENFVRLANKRINKTLNDIRLIGNLSNKTNYNYKKEEVKKIFNSLEKELEICKQRFECEGRQNEKFKLT